MYFVCKRFIIQEKRLTRHNLAFPGVHFATRVIRVDIKLWIQFYYGRNQTSLMEGIGSNYVMIGIG